WRRKVVVAGLVVSRVFDLEHFVESFRLRAFDYYSEKTNKIDFQGSAFKQQRLKSCQPVIAPKSVIPVFLLIAIIFAPLGGYLLHESDKVSRERKNTFLICWYLLVR